MGVNADGKINLSVGIDEGQIKQSASQVKSILKKEISTINLDQLFNDKKIQQEVQQSINNINKVLSKSKFKNLDFSTLIPKVDSIMSNTNLGENERSQIISGLSNQFGNLDKYVNKDIISLLSDNSIMENYVKDLTNIVDFVRSIKGLSTKEQDKMIKSLSKADISDIASAFTLKDLKGTYGSNLKFKMKPKEIASLLNDKLIDNLDPTNEEQLRNFLGIYNRGKYLAQTDKSKKGEFRNLFEQFQKKYYQEIEAFRTQYPDIFNQMERNVLGMSQDFDNIYNTKYKNKPLDTANLVKGLKTNKTVNQLHNVQTEKAPTSAQEVADAILQVQSDVIKLDEKAEKAKEISKEAVVEAKKAEKEVRDSKSKNTTTQKANTLSTSDSEKNDLNQNKEPSSSPALEQTKEEIDNAIKTEENILKRLQEESDLLQTEKEVTESAKTKLEKRNETINKVIKNNFKDESKKSNYENLKNQHDNYANKKKANDNAWKELDSFEQYSPEWRIQLVKAQQAKEEEEKAWIKYYKAFDIAKNGKNQVAKSRLDKFNPQNEGLTEFDNKTYEIYIESLKAAMVRNQKGIDECEEDLKEYHKKKDELDKKINELNNNIVNDDVSSNKTPTPSNKLKSNNQTKPNIPVDLQQELESAFGFDFSNDIDSTAQAEENLRKKTDNANKSLEDQNTITDNIAKNADSLMYYMGQINGDKTVLSNIFGTELQNQNNIGTGLLTSKSSKEYSNSVLSNENLDEYYAIDTSELKIYEAHAEETAKEFYDFIHHLEQFCISMGTGFEGFDDNLENVNEESLYATAQKLFPDLDTYFNDFDEFYEYINEMIDLVSKSGINADGTINKINMHLFQKENGTDDIKTRFLKEMGYQGVNLSGTKYGNNVIFNPLDNIKVVASGKNIEEVVEQAINKVSSKQEKNVGETKSQTSQSKPQTGGTTNTKKAIEEQEELEEKTKKATNALKDQQQTLAQSNVKPSSQNPPEESAKEDDTEKNKSKSKPSVRIKKPIKSINKDEVKSDLNEVAQGEADSAHEASNEVKGFNIIAGSAEEAAEAKKKFVEANKDVLQSIVASMPKIEQEAKALEKVKEVSNTTKTTKETKSKEDNSKTKDRKGYFDFEAMPNDLIEQRYSEISPLPVLAKGVSLASNKLDDEVQSSVELLEELHTAWDRGQQEIKDIIYDSTIENMQQEYVESQRPQYDFEPDYENIAQQAQEARQYYEDQISDDFEVKVETKLNLIEDETGQLSLFDNILPEDNWGQELKQNVDTISQTAIEGQISFQDLENAIKNSEQAYNKLISTKNKDGKSFIQNTDLPDEFLKTYESISTKNGEGYKATSNLRELKNLGDELANIKTKLKVSFDEAGNLKSFADPLEIQSLLERYDELTQKIQRLKLLIESPDSQEFKLLRDTKEAEVEVEKLTSTLEKAYAKLSSSEKITTDTEKLLNPFAEANIPMTESIEQMIDSIGRMRDIHSELASSFDSEGKLIGDPQKVQNLITEYNNLSKVVDELKVKISSPTSEENIALNLAKDAEKAKKELDSLKQKIDKNLGNSGLFEAQTQKTINTYGAFGGNGEGKRGALIESGDLKDERFIKQQEQVQELVSKLREYKTAIQELQTLRASDDATTEQLIEANDKVKELKDNITTLSQTIKTSGIANASEEQIGKLKSGIESFLQRTPNLTGDVREQLEEYIKILNSGASVSKTSYNSMAADLNKFKSAQASSTSIWEQMVGKMREGIAFLATKFSFYQIFNQFRQGFEVIHQFDDALTEMMKVSDETRTSLERYQKTTFETADAIGTSALQIQNSTADFMRLGETLDQAAESAKSANVLMNVSEFQSIDEATKSLIAMGAAYNDLSKMNIIDKLNEVGLKIA